MVDLEKLSTAWGLKLKLKEQENYSTEYMQVTRNTISSWLKLR